MNPRERGFLLLTSHLGDPERNPLTNSQMHTLFQRMENLKEPEENRQLKPSDLSALGYSREMAEQIWRLLDEEELLEHYLRRGAKQGCIPVTRVSTDYPLILRRRMGLDAPGCLWCRGDAELLNSPGISLVGSRELREENRSFAEAVGYYAARQGLTLISGNARGADRAAQNACLAAGGRVISVVADGLVSHPEQKNLLYVSEDVFDGEFSPQRAHSRNRVIHALGRMVFVAQSDLEKGGTWKGTAVNLKHGWSSVACFRDGSEASLQLEQMGAYLIGREDLADFGGLMDSEQNLFTR